MGYQVQGQFAPPVRLLPRRLPFVATAARQILARQDVVAGERVVERWIRVDGLDVRVLLAARYALADAWAQLGQVAPRVPGGDVLYVVELHHVPARRDEAEVTPALLRRSNYLWRDREAAVVAGRGEAARLGITFREVR